MEFSPVAMPGAVEVRSLASPGTPLERGRKDATRHAAEDFESVFIAQMIEPMFEGIRTDGMFGGGSGEQVFRSLMIQEVGKQVSQSGGIGITDSIYAEMLKLQGLDPSRATPAANNLSSTVLGELLKQQGLDLQGDAT